MSEIEKGFLAIKLVQLVLATKPEILLTDEDKMEIKKAWSLSRRVLTTEEIAVFKEMLKNYGNEDK